MFQILSAYQKDLEGFRLLNSCHAKIHPIALSARPKRIAFGTDPRHNVGLVGSHMVNPGSYGVSSVIGYEYRKESCEYVIGRQQKLQ